MRDYFLQIHEKIQELIGCESTHAKTVAVRVTRGGHLTWAGQVEVLDLQGCERAQQCFAWDFLRENGDWHITTFLQIAPILTPHAAVRAAIAARERGWAGLRLLNAQKRKMLAAVC